jgi:membrane-bound serine protease (ClpP class)
MIKRKLLYLCCLAIGWIVLQYSVVQAAQENQPNQPHVAQLTIAGAIGPATTDYLLRSMRKAEAQGATIILIRMDTPGGLDAATRDIIKAILASKLPVITYVHPSGSRAASAGTYILYASHIAAMTPATTLGAATPIQIGAPGLPGATEPESEQDKDKTSDKKDEKQNDKTSKAPAGGAMERKIINDAVAFIRGLANRHNRNAEWAEQAVREAVSLTADEALVQNVVDIVAVDVEDLLAQVDGRNVQMEKDKLTLATEELPIQSYDPDWRNELLALLTNPQVAYILLLIGIYGLIFEGYNPGAMVPGVVGVICLLLALYALQLLPVNYAGLALIIVGALLILAEALMPSFGILGIGGVIALVLGSLMLIDTDIPGMEVSRALIGSLAAISSLAVLGVMMFVGRSLRIPRIPIEQAMVGRLARVKYIDGNNGQVVIEGELWRARGSEPLYIGQQVRVTAQNGLTLHIESIPDKETEQ